jgi:hypothetical protein
MERLYSAHDIAQMFDVSLSSAYNYIKQMEHYDQPCLRVKESVLKEYLEAHTVYPQEKKYWNKPTKLPYR